jgi:excinuclease ABC subunit C
MTIKEKLSLLPEKSGVYIMRDSGGNVIYVGKAVLLTRRVRQYFNNSPKPAKVQAMVDNVADFDYIITLTEKDALALEANLIRKYKPYYNILLKDDKHSPYIKIDLKEKYPTIEITRKVKRDGARYFGPYFNGVRVSEIVDVIRSAYRMRTCPKKLQKRSRACLNHFIDLCPAPCMGAVSEEEYRESVHKVMRFLSGYDDSAETLLQEKMANAVMQEEFERAITYRDQLEMLKKLRERTVANLGAVTDVDAFACASSGTRTIVSVCIVRGNKMMGVKNYSVNDASMTVGETLTDFLVQYYGGNNEIPQEICLPEQFDTVLLSEYLTGLAGKSPQITFPQKGAKMRLIKTAQSNASDYLVKSREKAQRDYDMSEGATKLLASILNIKSAHRIECYDISNISGVDKVASQSVFIGGRPSPADYRKYKIKTVEGADDFKCMEEVIRRRLSRANEDDDKFNYLPDLIVIDGGKGQLSHAYGVMKELGYDIAMVSLAEREEEIFTPFSPDPIVLTRDNYALRLMQRVRDEAHRFAVTYHRKLRSKRYFSELDEVEGIGPKRRKILLKAFENFEDIKSASVETLCAIEGIDSKTAHNVYDYFHKKDE